MFRAIFLYGRGGLSFREPLRRHRGRASAVHPRGVREYPLGVLQYSLRSTRVLPKGVLQSSRRGTPVLLRGNSAEAGSAKAKAGPETTKADSGTEEGGFGTNIWGRPQALGEICVSSRREKQQRHIPRCHGHCATAHGRAASPPPSPWRGCLLGTRIVRPRCAPPRTAGGTLGPRPSGFAHLLGGLHAATGVPGACRHRRNAAFLALGGGLGGFRTEPVFPIPDHSYI